MQAAGATVLVVQSVFRVLPLIWAGRTSRHQQTIPGVETLYAGRVQNYWQSYRKLYGTRRAVPSAANYPGVLKPARLRLLAVPSFDLICISRAGSIARWSRDSSWS